MTSSPMKVFVCTTCRPKPPANGNEQDRPGQRMFERLQDRIDKAGLAERVCVEPVECLSVCKRPATIALTTPTHWTYIYGDLDPEKDLEDIITGLLAYSGTEDGIVPWADRVSIFKSGVVARIPPSEPVEKSISQEKDITAKAATNIVPDSKQSEIA